MPVLRRTLGIVGSGPRVPTMTLSQLQAPIQAGPALHARLNDVFQGLGAGAESRPMAELLLSSAGASMAAQASAPINDLFNQAVLARGGRPFRFMSVVYGDQLQIPIGQMAVEARKSAVTAQGQLQNDVSVLETANAEINRLNERVLPILKVISGADLGAKPEAWETWWLDQVGFRIIPQKASDTTTIVEQVPIAYQPAPVPIGEVIAPVAIRLSTSCFGKGTLVRTLSGTQAIETLRPGDLVLSQNIKTGALGYEPVLRVHHNPPSRTFRIVVGDETIVSSEFHRFWKAGRGWVMARDLKAGDTLRTLGGLAAVAGIEPGTTQPVFNLDVADNADFFVGQGAALVHDNSLPDLRLAPFDLPPAFDGAVAE